MIRVVPKKLSSSFVLISFISLYFYISVLCLVGFSGCKGTALVEAAEVFILSWTFLFNVYILQLGFVEVETPTLFRRTSVTVSFDFEDSGGQEGGRSVQSTWAGSDVSPPEYRPQLGLRDSASIHQAYYKEHVLDIDPLQPQPLVVKS